MPPVRSLQDFYRASPMREGVLCWYPFTCGARVLDLSGGILSDLLRRRCSHVETDWPDGADTFDYIVVLDPDDFGFETLRRYRDGLTPHGRLLLAYENPHGLRYWAGKRSPVTGFPYDPLFDYDGRLSKAELRNRLKQAGMPGQKWYYPLTDHWFTREVYSDDCLPDEYLHQRFIPYVAYDAALQYDERGLYREIIRGGAFSFMCGAYLVEARADPDDPPCAVDYAAVTAYRDPAKRFATAVYHDGTVWKTPLHPDGQESALHILHNHEELASLGVPVVPVKLAGDSLVMPRVDLPTLWDYWVKKITDGSLDEAELISPFDRIRDNILLAAKTGKCFWELVPANCFYDKENDTFLFFDQEYAWENVSPDMAVVRALWALHYSPALRADPRSEGWLTLLKERYGLTERWDALSSLADQETFEFVFGNGAEVLERESARVPNCQEPYRTETILRSWRFSPIPKRLKALGYSRPAVYGYGVRGRTIIPMLNNMEMTPVAIVDRNPPFYQRAEDIPADADVMLVSVLDGENIAAELRSKLKIPVYLLEDLLHEETV